MTDSHKCNPSVPNLSRAEKVSIHQMFLSASHPFIIKTWCQVYVSVSCRRAPSVVSFSCHCVFGMSCIFIVLHSVDCVRLSVWSRYISYIVTSGMKSKQFKFFNVYYFPAVFQTVKKFGRIVRF